MAAPDGPPAEPVANPAAAPTAPAPASVPNRAPGGSLGGPDGGRPAPIPDSLPPEPEPVSTLAEWTASMAELDRGYVENKGWGDASKMLDSYRALEKQMRGGPDGLVRKPQDGAEQSEWDAFYGALGRPDSAADYNFDGTPGPAEDVHDLTPQLREWAHKYGLNEWQARGMYGEYNQTIGGLQSQLDVDRAKQADRDNDELRRDWGTAYDENIQAGRRFLNRFNIADEVRLQLEDSLGTKAFVSLAAEIGRGLGEHVAPTGAGPDSGREMGFGMTPAAAKQRILELRTDNEFMANYVDGNLDAQQRMTKLHALAFPEESS